MTNYDYRLRDFGLTDAELRTVLADIRYAIDSAVENERERIAQRFDAMGSGEIRGWMVARIRAMDNPFSLNRKDEE